MRIYPFVGLTLVLLLHSGGKVVALDGVVGNKLVESVSGGGAGGGVLVGHVGLMINIECNPDIS